MASIQSVRVVVTGAAGFIGAHLVRRLAQDGHSVACVLPRAPSDVLPGRVHVVRLPDGPSIRDVLRREQPDAVVHLAAQSSIGASWSNPSRTMQVNVEGTTAVLEAIEAVGGARLVFASSVDVYGDGPLPLCEDAPTSPVSPYGISKLAAERCVDAFAGAGGWEAVTLRLGTVFGPGQDQRRLIPVLVDRGFRGEPLSVVPVSRDFVHVADVVEAIVLALDRGSGVVNVAGGEETPLPSLARDVRALTGRPDARVEIRDHQPHPDVRRVQCDLSKAADELGWTPSISLSEGLRELVSAPAVA